MQIVSLQKKTITINEGDQRGCHSPTRGEVTRTMVKLKNNKASAYHKDMGPKTNAR